MNRQQGRALVRKNKKEIKKRVKVLEKINPNDTRLAVVKWVESLSKEEAKLCDTFVKEYTASHIRVFSTAFFEIIENFLIEEGYDEYSKILSDFSDQLSETGSKLSEIENNGGKYYMSLNKDKESIIEDYKEKIKKGMSHEEAIKDIYTKYNKYSKSSLKNIIKTSVKTEQKEDNCSSNSCPYMKDKKCTNSHVLSKEKSCINFNEEQKAINIKEKAIEYFNNNKDKSKEEIINNLVEELNSKKETIERYYRTWIKENGIQINEDNEDFEKEIQNNGEGEKEMSKFKILKKVVVLDLEGEYGQYHIENNKVNFNDVEYANAEDVDSSFKIKEEELTNRLIALRKQKEELKEVMKEYVNEV